MTPPSASRICRRRPRRPLLRTATGVDLTPSYRNRFETASHADFGSLSAQTGLSLRLTKIIGPADAPAKFGGANDPSRAPQVVYPPNAVMVPPNMNEIEWHYRPGAGNDLFELGVKSALLDLRVYFACNTLGAGCGYAPDTTVWGILSSAGRGDDALP